MENEKNIKNDQQEEEVVNIRHTITAEETFTLAKDVFDLRCFIKNVYANRAVISRRLNILTLTISTVFMLLYSAYVLFTGLTKKLNFTSEIVLYAFLGAYAVLFIVFIVISICSSRSSTKNVKRYKKTLKIFKLLVRLISVGISITALVFSRSGSELNAPNVALDIVIIIFSIITIVFQVIPLIFGGLGKLVRWLLSPVKVKVKFSKVILEWYELVGSGSATDGAAKKVSKKYLSEIGAIIDNYLVPALGKRFINSITSAQLLTTVERANENDRPILEGMLKNIFTYATECSYVTFNPCKDLNFEGSVEVEEKAQKTTFKGKLLKMGEKIGKSMLDKYITGSSDKAEK